MLDHTHRPTLTSTPQTIAKGDVLSHASSSLLSWKECLTQMVALWGAGEGNPIVASLKNTLKTGVWMRE